MYTATRFGLRGTLAAVLAAVIVGFNGLALDRAHLSAAPSGIVEVGELTAISGLAAIDMLPQLGLLDEIVVSAKRKA
jgi:hypothetical protein